MEMISVFYMWNINIKAAFLYYEPKNHITLYATLAQLVEQLTLNQCPGFESLKVHHIMKQTTSCGLFCFLAYPTDMARYI